MILSSLPDMKDSLSEVNQDMKTTTHLIEETELEEEEEEFQKRDMEKETGDPIETKSKKLLLKVLLKKLPKDKAGLMMLKLPLKLKKKKRKILNYKNNKNFFTENLKEGKEFQKKKNTLRKSLDTLLMTSWNQNPQLQVKSKQEKLKESKVPRLKLMRSPRIKLKQRFKINISSNPSLKLQMQAQWISDSKPKLRRLQEEEITEEEEEEEEVEEVEEMFKKEVMLKLLKEEEENQTQKLL